MDTRRELRFTVDPEIGEVSAILVRPSDARWLLVYGHGAGAGMGHAFMESTAEALAWLGIATLRYMFPYAEAGRRRPDRPKLLLPTIEAAVRTAAELMSDTGGELPLIAGGKSMGGRMTSTLASQGGLGSVRGLVFFGFPLHAPGREGVERGLHLGDVSVPMLFLQGTRDRLADPSLIRQVIDGLGDHATLHVVEGADHGFHVLKRSGRTDADVIEELAETTAAWADTLEGPMARTAKVNLAEKFGMFDDHWHPRIVGQVGDTQVKVARLLGSFDWHAHEDEDELFLVHRGRLLIRLRDRDVWLNEGEFYIVPRGVEHQPVAEQEVELVLIEPVGTLNTGDAESDRTVRDLEWI